MPVDFGVQLRSPSPVSKAATTAIVGMGHNWALNVSRALVSQVVTHGSLVTGNHIVGDVKSSLVRVPLVAVRQ